MPDKNQLADFYWEKELHVYSVLDCHP